MTRMFIYTKVFDSLWKSLAMSEEDLISLEKELINNPSKGTVIQGTKSLRKLRWKIPGKGKSGGVRILYVDFPKNSILIIITLIKKNEKDNISAFDKKAINKFIKEFEINLI